MPWDLFGGVTKDVFVESFRLFQGACSVNNMSKNIVRLQVRNTLILDLWCVKGKDGKARGTAREK